MDISYAKIAEGHGTKAYQVHSIEELKKTTIDTKNQTQSMLTEINVLSKTMTTGYDGSRWNVGVAEVLEKPAVREVCQVKREKLATARKYQVSVIQPKSQERVN